MKFIASALTLLTLLSVSIPAQTSSATAPLLRIKRFYWTESGSPFWCDDCSAMPQAARDYRFKHRAGAGDFLAVVVLKNLSNKPIASVRLDFVFRDTATEREFLTYNLLFEKKIGRGQTKELRHKISKGKETDNFLPAGPSEELVNRTRECGDGPLLLDRKTGHLVRIRDDEKLLKSYPCYYTPVVTQIEYTDGSVWRP